VVPAGLKSLFVGLKVYSKAEKFIRLVRIKQKFIRIAYLYSKCTDCRINIRTLSVNIKFICTSFKDKEIKKNSLFRASGYFGQRIISLVIEAVKHSPFYICFSPPKDGRLVVFRGSDVTPEKRMSRIIFFYQCVT
jgi:hypothetical protein